MSPAPSPPSFPAPITIAPEPISRRDSDWGWRKRSGGLGGGGFGQLFTRAAPEPEPPKQVARQSAQFYSQSEELWVISRPIAKRESDDGYPGTGAMLSKETSQPMPLKRTSVSAKVTGYIATVEVQQQFHNPFSSKIEAVYVFPLPENSAVNEFLMVIGERKIRGLIRERAEAERIYNDAKRQGYVASLLTQERPNIFTQSVANIEPGKEIDVNIKYFNTLAYMDGAYEFVFPMVVGPRFNPPGFKNGVGAVPWMGASKQARDVHYLKPGQRSGHDISMRVEIDAGVPIEEVESATHQISKEQLIPEKCVVTLDPADRLPNRDFVCRYKVAGGQIKSGLQTQVDERGGFFTLMVYPPENTASVRRQPLEIVFVLDCSGSMSGRPLDQAKEAIRSGLKFLQPADSFQLINFSVSAAQMASAPMEATSDNIRRALNYLDGLNAEGGTMMITGIKAALDFPHDPRRLRFICFLTDGYIGNETEILGAVHAKLGASRIFSFGLGSSVNRYLLDQMARTGRGAVAYLLPETDSSVVMRDFFERIGHPALKDAEVDWAGMNVADVFPSRIPDLFRGRPILLTGRFSGAVPKNLALVGWDGEQRVRLPITQSHSELEAHAISSVWARAKISDLSDRMLRQRDAEDLKHAIRKTALDYSILSDYTAFLAVDSSRRTEGREGTTVPVGVPVPAGVKYETTVQP